MDQLKKLRQTIDKIDHELTKILAKRFAIAQKIQKIKRRSSISVKQIMREAAILKKQTKAAGKRGLPKIFVMQLYRLIFRYSRKS